MAAGVSAPLPALKAARLPLVVCATTRGYREMARREVRAGDVVLEVGSAALFKNPFAGAASNRGSSLPGQWFIRLRANVPFTLLKQSSVSNNVLTSGRCNIDCNSVFR